VINIDETWINETSFIRKVWGKRDGEGNVILNSVSPRLSMIAALDNEGNVWYTLSHANTDSNMIALFLLKLTKSLDSEQPGW
jgi:hypothetical protein